MVLLKKGISAISVYLRQHRCHCTEPAWLKGASGMTVLQVQTK